LSITSVKQASRYTEVPKLYYTRAIDKDIARLHNVVFSKSADEISAK
jgi:hypothetical protein